jgi:LysM repeat protein
VVVGVLLLVAALPLAASPEWQGTIHVVQPGEHLTAIANRYGTTPQAIASANNLVNMNLLYVGQRLTIPGSASPAVQSNSYYVVDPGDTLSGIAARYGTTTQALVDANGLASANLIYVGQRTGVIHAIDPVRYHRLLHGAGGRHGEFHRRPPRGDRLGYRPEQPSGQPQLHLRRAEAGHSRWW